MSKVVAKGACCVGLLWGLGGLMQGMAAAQTLPTGRTSWREALRVEAEALVQAGVSKPYGVGWTVQDGKPVSYDAGATPAAGLALLLTAEVTGETRFEEAAVAVGRGIGLSLDPSGRLPTTVVFGNSISGREQPGSYPKREASLAGLGFVLYLDRHLKGEDARVAGTGTRLASWVIKGEKRPGVFPVGHSFPGENYPRQIVRWDTTDMRDGVLALLMISRCTVGESKLPDFAATKGARQAVEALLKGRINDIGKASRFLWPTASKLDDDLTMLKDVPEFPATGHLLGTRYALQALMAAYLAGGDGNVFDAVRQSAEALGKIKDPKGWLLVDDVDAVYLASQKTKAEEPTQGSFVPAAKPEWPHGDWGISPTLGTVADVKALTRETFNKSVGKRLPPELMYAALLTGLTDALPRADFPLNRLQVEDYVAAHPETFKALESSADDLKGRLRRIWALYWLARWEKEFGK